METKETKVVTLSTKKVSLLNLTGRGTLIIIVVLFMMLSLITSYFFSKSIEGFFWEARTKSVVDIIYELGKHTLQKNDISSWKDNEPGGRVATFAKEIREYIPNTSAVKIYTTDGILAWTNLKNLKQGYQKPASDGELSRVSAAGSITMNAGDSVKQELGKTDLLEVWTTLKDTEGNMAGFVEIYFDTNDIKIFVSKIKYSIWIATFVLLSTIVFLLRLAFRKQDELIIRQAEELANIVEQSPIGIYTIDKYGIIENYNPAMMKISGITDANETIGKNVFDADAYKKTGLDKLLEGGLAGKAFETEVEIESSLGEHKKTFRHYRGAPIKNESGEVVNLLVMVEDITARKKLEREIASRTENLEKGVDERTKSLQEKIDELERFQRLTVDRELRMAELKQEIEKMRIKLESLGVKADTI